jgi:hypothetical protein
MTNNFKKLKESLNEALNLIDAKEIAKELKLKNPSEDNLKMIQYGYDNKSNDEDGMVIKKISNDYQLGRAVAGMDYAESKNDAYTLKQAKKNVNTYKLRLNKENK